MGRRKFKRNRNNRISSGVSSSSSASASSPKRFGNRLSVKDKKVITRYLNEYREKCMDLYNGKRKSRKRYMSDRDTPIVIAGCIFPMLTNAVLLQPYLALPKELTGKQRKFIHESCVYANLYHAGAGMTRDERFIAISIYSDGLYHVPYVSSDPEVSFLNFKPWCCRKDFNGISPKEATKHGHDAIYKLVDQPWTCLRDGIDFIDMKEMEGEDLSNTVPPLIDDETWMLVDSPEKMLQCIQELEDANVTEIGFDLECYNKGKSHQLTCLIQLATSNGKEYVIDTQSPGVWDTVNGLAPIFANPDVVKIGHGIGGMDVQSLHRDFGIFVANAFDTHEAAKSLRMPGKGLAKICATYGLPNCEVYAELKETYQNTDWSRRPLEDPMILYGRHDVHYLIQLRRLMMRDLVKQELWSESNPMTNDAEAKLVAESLASMISQFDEEENSGDESKFLTPTNSAETTDDFQNCLSEEQEAETTERKSHFDVTELRMNTDLMQTISGSQEFCLKLWKENAESHLKDPEFQSLIVRSQNSKVGEWTPSQLELYDNLAQWREETARREECTVGFICTMGFLALIALKRPTSRTGLLQLSYKLPEFFQTYNIDDLLELVRKSRLHDRLHESGDFHIPCYLEFLERKSRRKEMEKVHYTLALTVGIVGVVVIAAVAILRGKR